VGHRQRSYAGKAQRSGLDERCRAQVLQSHAEVEELREPEQRAMRVDQPCQSALVDLFVAVEPGSQHLLDVEVGKLQVSGFSP